MERHSLPQAAGHYVTCVPAVCHSDEHPMPQRKHEPGPPRTLGNMRSRRPPESEPAGPGNAPAPVVSDCGRHARNIQPSISVSRSWYPHLNLAGGRQTSVQHWPGTWRIHIAGFNLGKPQHYGGRWPNQSRRLKKSSVNVP